MEKTEAKSSDILGMDLTGVKGVKLGVVLTAILCPLMVSFLTKWSDKWFEKRGRP